MIILLTGLPGTGKTEVAKFLNKKIQNSFILRNDEIRRELFGEEPYNEDQKGLLDKTVLERTRTGIKNNQTVILDRISPFNQDREMFKDLAQNLDTSFVLISVSSSKSLVKERIEKRLAEDCFSAPFAVYLLWASRYEAPSDSDYDIVNDGDLVVLEKNIDEIIQKL